MESIDDYQRRKQERAEMLLGSNKKQDRLNRLSKPKVTAILIALLVHQQYYLAVDITTDRCLLFYLCFSSCQESSVIQTCFIKRVTRIGNCRQQAVFCFFSRRVINSDFFGHGGLFVYLTLQSLSDISSELSVMDITFG